MTSTNQIRKWIIRYGTDLSSWPEEKAASINNDPKLQAIVKEEQAFEEQFSALSIPSPSDDLAARIIGKSKITAQQLPKENLVTEIWNAIFGWMGDLNRPLVPASAFATVLLTIALGYQIGYQQLNGTESEEEAYELSSILYETFEEEI